MNASEACLGATNSSFAPWFIVPADDKPNVRLIVSQIIVEILESMDLSHPEVSADRLGELQSIRK